MTCGGVKRTMTDTRSGLGLGLLEARLEKAVCLQFFGILWKELVYHNGLNSTTHYAYPC